MKEFALGNIVELQSGGPSMTVTDVIVHSTCTLIQCLWFEGEGRLGTASFHPETLRHVQEKQMGFSITETKENE